MSEVDTGSVKPAAEVSVEEFARLVASISRLLSGLGRMEPLREAGISLGEWVALATLARASEGVTNKALGRVLGVRGQRTGEISSSLLRAGLVTIGQAGQNDKVHLVKISDAGKAKLESIDASMKPMLSQALNGRTLLGAKKQMKSLGRLLVQDTPEKSNKRKEKRAAKAGKKKADAAKAE
ncbi:MAG: MarR family winged helix-turn-helix transcriptional regulator [Reyranella sp.]